MAATAITECGAEIKGPMLDSHTATSGSTRVPRSPPASPGIPRSKRPTGRTTATAQTSGDTPSKGQKRKESNRENPQPSPNQSIKKDPVTIVLSSTENYSERTKSGENERQISKLEPNRGGEYDPILITSFPLLPTSKTQQKTRKK